MKFKTFSKSSSGRTDWLCDSIVKLDVLRSILPDDNRSTIRILIPGIGHSTLACDLYKSGYSKVTVADLDDNQVNVDTKKKFNPRYFDLLGPVPEDLFGAFDYVIDSSVTDVFLQGTISNVAYSKRVHKKLLSMLKEDGTMIVFSMNIKQWDDIYDDAVSINRLHSRLRPLLNATTSRGRQTKKVGDDVLVLIASRRTLKVESYRSEHALVTEWTKALPEDWASQR